MQIWREIRSSVFLQDCAWEVICHMLSFPSLPLLMFVCFFLKLSFFLVIVLIFDPVSNACVNPSVAMLSLVGAPLHGHPIPPSIWVYFVAPFVGATCAAFLFRVISPNDHAPARFLFKGPVDHRDQTAPHSSTRLPEIQ